MDPPPTQGKWEARTDLADKLFSASLPLVPLTALGAVFTLASPLPYIRQGARVLLAASTLTSSTLLVGFTVCRELSNLERGRGHSACFRRRQMADAIGSTAAASIPLALHAYLLNPRTARGKSAAGVLQRLPMLCSITMIGAVFASDFCTNKREP